MQKPIIVGTFAVESETRSIEVTPLPECLERYFSTQHLVFTMGKRRLIVQGKTDAARLLFQVMSNNNPIERNYALTPQQLMERHRDCNLPLEWADDESLKPPTPSLVLVHLNLLFDHLTPEMVDVLHAMNRGDSKDLHVLSYEPLFNNPRWRTFLQGCGVLKVNSVDKYFLDLRGTVDNSDGLLNRFLDWVMPFTVQKHGSKLVGMIDDRAVYKTFDGWMWEAL